ncbi:MAG: ferritin family protein [Candidatus Micrarchaeota archaeon]
MNTEEILHTAIKIEEEGIEFYTASSEKIKDENGKSTLLFLADEEKRHKAFFENVLREHGKGDEKSVKLLARPRIFPEPKDYKESEAGPVDQDILEHALETEKRSIKFYEDSKIFADEKLREGLNIIIHEEIQHAEWIKFLLENITSHQAWGPLGGRFSLDGG